MDILANSVGNVTSESVESSSVSQQNEATRINISNRRTSLASDNHANQSAFTYMCCTCRLRTVKFVSICSIGAALLISGATLIVLYFVSDRHGDLLIPALALFIVGITMTSVGEWYCRMKLRQRHERRRMRAEESLSLAIGNFTERCAQMSDLPPPYRPGLIYSMQRIPTSLLHRGDQHSRHINITTDQVHDDVSLPPYSVAISTAEDELPTYQQATFDDLAKATK